MPTETRHINFSAPEVVEALSEFRRGRRLAIPGGEVRDVSFSEPPDIRATLSIRVDETHDVIAFQVGSETLAAALVFYCINHGIPLPARAVKQLQRHPAGVSLVVSNPQRSRRVVKSRLR